MSDFSHVEVLFYMHRVDPDKIELSARHPRNEKSFPKVGIFAQRGKNRPNQIGLTICEIKKIEGTKIHLIGLDAMDGSPVLDLKPYFKEFGPRGSLRQPSWSYQIMKNYWSPEADDGKPSIFSPVILDTPNVKIRPLDQVDPGALAAGLLYEDSFHALNWGIKTAEDIRVMYDRSLAALQARKGNPIVFLNLQENEVLGMTNFMSVEPENKMIEIGGTWINKKYQRTFVNTETKFALLQYAFETLNLNRVEFRIDAENLKSQAAVKRLGFNFDGLMPRRKVNPTGQIRDYVLYSVTDLTWPSVKSHILALMNHTSHRGI